MHENNGMDAQVTGVSLLGIATVLRLERGCMVKGQMTKASKK